MLYLPVVGEFIIESEDGEDTIAYLKKLP